MKVAVVGATGLVGSKMLQILAERNFPVSELIPVASEKSVGKSIELIFHLGREYEDGSYEKIHFHLYQHLQLPIKMRQPKEKLLVEF